MNFAGAVQHESPTSTVSSQIISILGRLGERLLLIMPSSKDSFQDSKTFWHAWQLLRDAGVPYDHQHLNGLKNKLEAQGLWLEIAPQAI